MYHEQSNEGQHLLNQDNFFVTMEVQRHKETFELLVVRNGTDTAKGTAAHSIHLCMPCCAPYTRLGRSYLTARKIGTVVFANSKPA